MATEQRGHELFIVDNSVSGWTGQRYLEEWAPIARSFDIATGYFEIGSLLALDGRWQGLEKIRILMGAEVTRRTRKALLEAVRERATAELDSSIEAQKKPNPFLHGVPAVLDALKSGQIECRVYDKAKFHAKAYITHAKLEVVGSQALVGSSNFTGPGLTQNIELNVQIQSAREVAQLQDWFEHHWDEASDVTSAIATTVARHTQLYSPFDIYAKALQEFFRGHELTDTEWEETHSRMFSVLDRYQKEAYWALMKMAREHGGAFLCDGVGLGKTFVGLMLIERLVLHEGKRVVLFAPKGAREGVWEPALRKFLSHIGGGGGNTDFSNLAVFNHTDLGRSGEFPERFQRITELADVVIIDEAHHFRNPGKRGNSKDEQSRYYWLYNLLENTTRPKSLFMLTATPINNRLSDFRHMAELFTRQDDRYFARTLGVNNLTAHFNDMEKTLRATVGHDVSDVSEVIGDAQDILAKDPVFTNLVVQRSRAYARESQLRESGKTAVFPNRKPPQVADYSIRKTYGRLLDMFEAAFQKQTPLFTLPLYYPLHWYKGPDTSIDPLDEGRQKQVVSLIRTQFLKRFESSVTAFELSCNRLLKKLLAFVQVHSETVEQKSRIDRWKIRHGETLGFVAQRELELWGDGDEEDDGDVVSQDMLEAVVHLDRDQYDVSEMISEAMNDLDQIIQFLEELRKFRPTNDDKLQKLIKLLKSKELSGKKILIFTEFADTARYLKHELDRAGISGVEQIDGSSKGNRADAIQRFAPYYNGTSSAELLENDQRETRVLVSTDVLSEGLNLQDASRMINYDIHWNPVRLMQRIGRVDRRMDPETEKRLVADHPDVASSRGMVSFWNFLPPEELNSLLSLYRTVTRKTLLISKTLGIEGRKLLRPDDVYDDLKVLKGFEEDYEGTKTAIEDMHLEYQALLQNDPDLEARLRRFPGATFSGRQRPAKGARGVFFCYSLPALDKEVGEFTEAAGHVQWYLYDLDRDAILGEPGLIAASIRSEPETPRHCMTEEKTLVELRGKVEQHIKNTYLKRVDAPIGVAPALKCWMELSER